MTTQLPQARNYLDDINDKNEVPYDTIHINTIATTPLATTLATHGCNLNCFL